MVPGYPLPSSADSAVGAEVAWHAATPNEARARTWSPRAGPEGLRDPSDDGGTGDPTHVAGRGEGAHGAHDLAGEPADRAHDERPEQGGPARAEGETQRGHAGDRGDGLEQDAATGHAAAEDQGPPGGRRPSSEPPAPRVVAATSWPTT